MALAALAAGETVWCEKPLAATPADAKEMAGGRCGAGPDDLGFSSSQPACWARPRIVASSKFGKPVGFRGIHLEDYMSDPAKPSSFRIDPAGGHSAIADIGSHIISVARHLMGEIDEVSGQLSTLVKQHAIAAGSTGIRTVEWIVNSRLWLGSGSGATGSIETDWMAHGRKLDDAGFELTCGRGTDHVDFERMERVVPLYATGQKREREGLETSLTSPDHCHYAAFVPRRRPSLGFNELKTIEAKILVDAFAEQPTGGLAGFSPTHGRSSRADRRGEIIRSFSRATLDQDRRM